MPPKSKQKKQACSQCKRPIDMQIFKGTGVCCELCRKIRDGDITAEEARGYKNVRDL